MEMRDEVLFSVGAQDLDTSSYQVSNLEDIEFNWENSQLDMDSVFRPGIDTPFLQQHLTIYRWEDQLKTPLSWMKSKTRRILFVYSIDSGVVRPTEPPRLQKSHPLGARLENVPDYVYRILFQ